MEWSKLKNIILIMLAAVNLCLLFFVVQREWRDSANQRQNRQQAVDFLTDRGIQIHEGQLPDDQMVPRPQTVERDQEEESRLATQLFGEDVVVQARGAGCTATKTGRAPSSSTAMDPFRRNYRQTASRWVWTRRGVAWTS